MIAVAVAKYLDSRMAALTFTETAATGNVFVGWMPDSPDIAVMVKTNGGDPQLTNDPSDTPGLQIIVRGARDGLLASYAMARTIYSELTCLDAVTLDDGGDHEVWVIGCTALQSDPTPMGQDSNQRPEWSINFRLHTHAPTAHRS